MGTWDLRTELAKECGRLLAAVQYQNCTLFPSRFSNKRWPI